MATRFPVSLTLIIAAAFCAQWPLGEGYAAAARALVRYEGMVASNVLPLVAGAGLALAASLFCEGIRWPWRRSVPLSALGGVIGYVLLKFHVALSVYFGAVLPAIVGLVLIAPFLNRGGRDAFWHWLFRMAMLALRTGLLALALGVALSVMVLALNHLLGFGAARLSVVRVWAFVGILVAPIVALMMIPRNFDTEPVVDLDAFVFGPVRTVLDWVAAPFLLIYAAMLHIYALRIVFGSHIPDGEIGVFALIFSIVLVGSVVVLRPLRRSVRPLTWFLLKWWPALLVAPILLLLVAGLLRVRDAGVTPDRYLFILAALSLATIVAIQVSLSTRNYLRLILIVPVFALVVASFGPWGALGVSIASQTNRFKELVAGPLLSEADILSARSMLMFLDRYDALADITPDYMPAADSRGQKFLRARIAAAYKLDQ